MVMYSYKGRYPVRSLPYRMEVEEMFNGRMKRRTYTAEAVTQNAEKFGYIEVADRPSHDAARQSCNWNSETLSWDVADFTDEHIAAMKTSEFSQLRQARNQKLLESDWSQVLYAAATDTEDAIYGHKDRQIKDFISREWEEYRQELRDLPANTEDARNVSWPNPPFLTGFELEADLEFLGVTATGDTISMTGDTIV